MNARAHDAARAQAHDPADANRLWLTYPPGVPVLHRTRMEAQGRLAVSRLDAKFREQWRATLPYQQLSNRWETGTAPAAVRQLE